MPTHNDIKTVAYLESILNYADAHLAANTRQTAVIT
jgi:hypothetical protein